MTASRAPLTLTRSFDGQPFADGVVELVAEAVSKEGVVNGLYVSRRVEIVMSAVRLNILV
jgi:hypothetical protein